MPELIGDGSQKKVFERVSTYEESIEEILQVLFFCVCSSISQNRMIPDANRTVRFDTEEKLVESSTESIESLSRA